MKDLESRLAVTTTIAWILEEIGDVCCSYNTQEYLEFLDKMISALQRRYQDLENGR